MPRAAQGFDVVIARLDPTPDEVRAAAALLSEAERSRSVRFHFARDRRRFVVARARLRELLAARLGVRAEDIELQYDRNGKPRIARGGLKFSVAHCEDVALYALSESSEIGADIEAIRPLPEADAIAARFFSRSEYALYSMLAPQDRPRGFLECWTRKEAFAKATGEGLPTLLDELDAARAPGWRTHSFSPLPGYIAAVAYQHG
jgi:4'-phosphopantetheinyl transferase